MISEKIAKYVRELDLDNVPTEVKEKLKLLIIDTLSVAIRGAHSNESDIVYKVFEEMGGRPESIVLRKNIMLPSPQAALINATMAHSIEMDDTDRFTYYHAGAPIIIASLAVAEQVGANGKQFLEGVLAGYEVSIRIADAVNPSHRDRGFHTTGTVGTFGAGVAAAKIMGLKEEKVIHTLGLSGTQAAGLFEFLSNGSMTKRIHPGKSAWNGIAAARLAEEGMTGPNTILEGEHGFLKATTDVSDESQLTDRLNENYRILRMGIKRHAACRYCHTPIDTALTIRNNPAFNLKKVIKVEVYVSEHCFNQTGKSDASTLMAAQLSTPYATALALVKGSAGIDEYTAGINDQSVLDVMDMVEVKTSNYSKYARDAKIKVMMEDDDILDFEMELPKGEPENPLSMEEILHKNKMLTEQEIGFDQFKELVNVINHLENKKDLTDVTAILQ